MASERPESQPRELVYLPGPSWHPALFAAGLAGVLAGLFVWWPYGAAGAIVAIVALVAMINEARENYQRLPRRQDVTLGRIPAARLKPDHD